MMLHDPRTILGWIIIALVLFWISFVILGFVLVVRQRRAAALDMEARRARMNQPSNPGRRPR